MCEREWDSGSQFDESDLNFIPTITLILECDSSRVDESTVEFVDISENPEGRDVLTFVCPKCGQTHSSLRYG